MEAKMFKNLTTPPTTRIAAGIAGIVLVLISALHVYWAFGGDWALSTLTDGTTKTTDAGFQVFAGAIALLALLAAIEIIAVSADAESRLHRLSRPKLVWAMVLILAFGGIARSASAPEVGITAIVLAALFAAVLAGTKPRLPRGTA
jgi:Protein of unknown function (DUF3995)